MLNRLFVVDADAKPKVAWPQPSDAARLNELRQRIRQQLARLPLTLDITPEGKFLWDRWYCNLPASENAKRLDTVGLRLMPILALTMDKNEIDPDVVGRVTAVLDYELRLRSLTDPIDTDSRIAKLEEKIRRNLRECSPLSKRELQQRVHAHRDGLWAFNTAAGNLEANDEVAFENGKYRLTANAEEET